MPASGAGKSSLINMTFRVQEDEGQANVSYLRAGVSDINQEIICRANPQFVLHDSQGFEGGETENLQRVETFLKERGASVNISKQVHAVWLCLPIPTAGGRIFETGVEKFLKMKINGKLGKIPVIAVFTKYDTLLTRAMRLGNPDPSMEAKKILNETCVAPFKKYEKQGIPHMAVSKERGHEQTLQALVELTTERVREQLPEVASIVLGVAQQVSPKVKIDSSIAVGKRKYWQSLGTSVSFRGKKLKDCFEVMRVDIVTVWAIEDPYDHLRGDEFQALILELVGEISDNRPGDANKALVAGMGAAIGFIGSGPAAPVLIPAAVVLVLAKWGYDVYQQIPDIIMRLMAYVVNLILVVQLLFLVLADRRCELTSSLIKTVVALYRDSHVKSEIHAKIKVYANGGLFSKGRDQTFENVSSLIKEYYDSEGIRRSLKLDRLKFGLASLADEVLDWRKSPARTSPFGGPMNKPKSGIGTTPLRGNSPVSAGGRRVSSSLPPPPAPPRRSPRNFNPGSEAVEGYAMSAMADLHYAYLKGEDSQHALFDRISALVQKQQIEKHDLRDRGHNTKDASRPRFAVENELFERVLDIVLSLQTLLETAFSLLEPAKENALYVVDPQGLMISRLKGSNSLYEMTRAWDVLITRVLRGQNMFEKYVYIYQKKLPNLASPSNTDPAVYAALEKEGSTFDNVVDRLYQGVPTLRERIKPEYAVRLDAGESLRSMLLSPVYLKEAFSPRQPESSPPERYFDELGNKFSNRPHRHYEEETNESRRARIAEPPVDLEDRRLQSGLDGLAREEKKRVRTE
ncbi:hypothetical protein HWV62_13986 [Athelia sp. TMB]|nr:hypothetical protein HWV62_13986 [Athelia sp. TMB]